MPMPDYYRQFGFREADRMKFKPDFAHNWDIPKQGTPDVVFMGWGAYPEGGPEAAFDSATSRDANAKIPNEPSRRYEETRTA
jgi:hypothetical protein